VVFQSGYSLLTGVPPDWVPGGSGFPVMCDSGSTTIRDYHRPYLILPCVLFSAHLTLTSNNQHLFGFLSDPSPRASHGTRLKTGSQWRFIPG